MNIIYDIDEGLNDINDFRSGTMPMGLGIGISEVDDHLVYKPGQFNVIAGLSNVGKTHWILWYMNQLSVRHGLKWAIYSSENEIWHLKAYLMEFISDQKIKEIDDADKERYWYMINEKFKFIRTDKLYTADELMKGVEDMDVDGILIDPHNSLKSPQGVNRHEYDYEKASEMRIFCRKHRKSIYLVAHCVTEAIRRVHPKEHDYAGHHVPPTAADIEGGGKWVNRADDFLILHRYIAHETEWQYTHVHVKKVKTELTGGHPTKLDNPLRFAKGVTGEMLYKGQSTAPHDRIETNAPF
jgi:hypothetical protein